MKLPPILMLVIIAVLSFTNTAAADVYDCTMEQAVRWEKGTLKKVKPSSKTVVRFNDHKGSKRLPDKGALWMGENPKSPHLMDLLQPLHDDNDLVASSISTSGNYTGVSVFRIRRVGQTKELYFLYTSEDGATSGPCIAQYKAPE